MINTRNLTNPAYGGVGESAIFIANNLAGEKVECPIHVIARRGMAEFSGDYNMKSSDDTVRFTFVMPTGNYQAPYAIKYKETLYAIGDLLVADNDGFVRVFAR